ncbi:hypothetical protein, partial [Allofournierella massiliensis]|uniref:hypothetical protein n=1 Tax=Allofournierella massiliensis TaxID=1650663 RepID=UPI003FED782E
PRQMWGPGLRFVAKIFQKAKKPPPEWGGGALCRGQNAAILVHAAARRKGAFGAADGEGESFL